MPTEVQNSYDSTIDLWNNGQAKAGQRLTISNRKINTLSFYLSKTGTPPGQIQWQIFSTSGAGLGTLLDSVAFMNCDDVTASPVLYTATMSGIFINDEVRICVAPT